MDGTVIVRVLLSLRGSMASRVVEHSASLLTETAVRGGVGLEARISPERECVDHLSFHVEDPLESFVDIRHAKNNNHNKFVDNTKSNASV